MPVTAYWMLIKIHTQCFLYIFMRMKNQALVHSKVVTHLQVNCPATDDVEASSEDAGTDHSLETHVTLAHLHHATITVITHVSKSLRQTKSLFWTMFL